jgi:hypothetical protein
LVRVAEGAGARGFYFKIVMMCLNSPSADTPRMK